MRVWINFFHFCGEHRGVNVFKLRPQQAVGTTPFSFNRDRKPTHTFPRDPLGTRAYVVWHCFSLVLNPELWQERFLLWMRLRNWSVQTQKTYSASLQEFLAFLDSQGVTQVSA